MSDTIVEQPETEADRAKQAKERESNLYVVYLKAFALSVNDDEAGAMKDLISGWDSKRLCAVAIGCLDAVEPTQLRSREEVLDQIAEMLTESDEDE